MYNVQVMDLTVRPLTAQLWPALEDLFGKAGASNGCWCMYWRLGPDYHRRPRWQNKSALRSLAENGPAPGLLAFDGDKAVGWCQLTPRSALPYLDTTLPTSSSPRDSVWSLSCFFVRRGYRNQGVSAALITAAVDAARAVGAAALEAYPVDTHAPNSTRNLFTGTRTAFTRAGFQPVSVGRYGRVLMRRPLP